MKEAIVYIVGGVLTLVGGLLLAFGKPGETLVHVGSGLLMGAGAGAAVAQRVNGRGS